MTSAHVFNGQFVKKNNTGPGPAPGRPAQRLDTATDHLTSTLATWAATCVQVIRARARGSRAPTAAARCRSSATARQRCRTHTVTASLPSLALGPVLHPSFQVNYHFNLKILLKLLSQLIYFRVPLAITAPNRPYSKAQAAWSPSRAAG